MTSFSSPMPGAARRRSYRGLVIVLMVGLAILLVLALVAVLLLRGAGTTGAPEPATGHAIVSPLPSATTSGPSPVSPLSSASAPSSAASTRLTVSASRTGPGPQVKTFAVVPQSAISGATVTCTKAENLMVDFAWSTSGATRVDFGVATLDASAAPYAANLPAYGSLGSGRAVAFQCYADNGMHTQFYTLTVLAPGQKLSRTITLKEKYVP